MNSFKKKDKKSKKKRDKKHKKEKRKRRSSSSSSSSSSDSSTSSSSSSSDEKHKRKKHKKRHKKSKDVKYLKVGESSRPIVPVPPPAPPPPDEDFSIPIRLMDNKHKAPETREEYEKRQSVIRRVVDHETGRARLIKGDGEILEEMVCRERHVEINKLATKTDGEVYQKKTIGWAVTSDKK